MQAGTNNHGHTVQQVVDGLLAIVSTIVEKQPQAMIMVLVRSAHDFMIFNAVKSLVMDSRNANLSREMTLGGKKLNFATSYKYLGHVICNDLSDEADIQAKVRLLYAKSNMLHQKVHLFYCYKTVYCMFQ